SIPVTTSDPKSPRELIMAPIPPPVPIPVEEPPKPQVDAGKKGEEDKKGDKKEPVKADNKIHIEADTLSYDQDTDTYHAKGNVVITYVDGVLSAVRVDFDRRTNEAFAEGQVVLQSRDGDVLEGEQARLDVEKKTGVILKGQVFVAKTHFYISGDRIEKRGDATYFVVNAAATACDGTAPDWRFVGKELDVTIDGYGTLTNGRFYAKDTPIFYSPYLLFPVKTTRQTGLLLPERLSYSQNKLGMDTSIPFYWAISKDSDATFYQRYMTARGFQEGVEYRYAMGDNSFGTIYGDFLSDQKKITETVGNLSRDWTTGDQKRWSLYFNHESRFDKTMYIRADVAKVSDSFYFKDFASYNYFLANYAGIRPQPFKRISFIGDESLTTLESNVRFVKAWNAYNFTARVRDTQDLTLATNDTTLQRYPELTLSGMKQSLFGTRVQYELSGVYDYFYRGQGQKGHLLDAYPTLSLPYRFGDYFNVTTFTGVRSLVWNRDDNVDNGISKQGNLAVYTAGATATSEVSRIYDIGAKSLDKVRHAIRPELTYIFSPNTEQVNVPDFVTAATQQNTATNALNKVLSKQTNGGLAANAPVASDQNSITYGVTNSVIARFKDEKGVKKYSELLRFKVAQTFDFKEANRENILADNNRKPLSDVNLEVDFKPLTNVTFLARNKYSVYNTAWSQANYDLILNDTRGDTASITYRYTQDAIEETNLILKAVISKSFSMILRLKRDQLNNRDVERMIGFDYRRQCWTIGFDFGQRNDDTTYAIRFAITGL
ncbi:MAG: LPS assembly protein LptD, partial [Syntrophales bacterium]|nr:LPS assembly protein LptD [Syntrophales bacterium]